MRFKVKTLEKLLVEVTQKAGKSLNFTDFKEITSEIRGLIDSGDLKGVKFGYKYIYDNIYQKIKKLDKEDFLNLNISYVDTIARYAGYDNFRKFDESLKPIKNSKTYTGANTALIEELMQRCGGTWWSYVRSNSGQPELLVAPMRIFQQNSEVWIQMKGEGNILFQSELTIEADCLRCLMDTGRKGMTQIYMVMKLGNALDPTVLLGVFAGMSKGGMPIGGREVWIKEENQELSFDDLSHRVVDLEGDKIAEHKNVLHYFKDRKQNCWKGTLPSSFDIRDLRNE